MYSLGTGFELVTNWGRTCVSFRTTVPATQSPRWLTEMSIWDIPWKNFTVALKSEGFTKGSQLLWIVNSILTVGSTSFPRPVPYDKETWQFFVPFISLDRYCWNYEDVKRNGRGERSYYWNAPIWLPRIWEFDRSRSFENSSLDCHQQLFGSWDCWGLRITGEATTKCSVTRNEYRKVSEHGIRVLIWCRRRIADKCSATVVAWVSWLASLGLLSMRLVLQPGCIKESPL